VAETALEVTKTLSAANGLESASARGVGGPFSPSARCVRSVLLSAPGGPGGHDPDDDRPTSGPAALLAALVDRGLSEDALEVAAALVAELGRQAWERSRETAAEAA
jgi:hypothetical protein